MQGKYRTILPKSTQKCIENGYHVSKIHSKEDSHTIFRDAAALNMTESGYVWIVTEQALNANNTPDGVIGLQLVHSKDEKDHIHVCVDTVSL